MSHEPRRVPRALSLSLSLFSGRFVVDERQTTDGRADGARTRAATRWWTSMTRATRVVVVVVGRRARRRWRRTARGDRCLVGVVPVGRRSRARSRRARWRPRSRARGRSESEGVKPSSMGRWRSEVRAREGRRFGRSSGGKKKERVDG